MHHKDLIVHSLKVTNSNEANVYEDPRNGNIHSIAPLQIEGGMTVKKGIKVGIQENLIPGLMIYDGENFMGFSEKYGLTLLSRPHQAMSLQIPESIFKKKLQSTQSSTTQGNQQSTSSFTNEQEVGEMKRLNIDLTIQDISNYYIEIPEIYQQANFLLHFDVNILFQDTSHVSEIHLFCINRSSKRINIQFLCQNYQIHFSKIAKRFVPDRESIQFTFQRISNHLFISTHEFD